MSVKSELHKAWKRVSDPEFRALKRQMATFRAAHGRGTPDRYSDLQPGDVVLDIGGYRGDWAERMTALYGVTVHTFEPHPRFIAHMLNRFEGRDDVHVHGYAIGSKNGTLDLSDDENASSALLTNGPTVSGDLRSVPDVFQELGLDNVAVAKINIEGGEYDLLPALIETGMITRINRITVQFHRYTDAQIGQRDAIRAQLEKTHDCVWDYPFIWEEWLRKTEQEG